MCTTSSRSSGGCRVSLGIYRSLDTLPRTLAPGYCTPRYLTTPYTLPSSRYPTPRRVMGPQIPYSPGRDLRPVIPYSNPFKQTRACKNITFLQIWRAVMITYVTTFPRANQSNTFGWKCKLCKGKTPSRDYIFERENNHQKHFTSWSFSPKLRLLVMNLVFQDNELDTSNCS